ncbi:MAG: tRNA (adenosine(37)-N6)-threonylcarbamoyltransferase complex dimerization subunit type 1 TsaB [Hydrogenophaga sp.]|uniref:tRNA (adenosine(37)-N6)-threonylcarbamoyltransferase complex dimerization subunit type 1 TsaB n=1 Tax=Hydrogenophaga sp. TaxID=1904254 RepID=UPI002633C1DA|nr:tRNA (adenosine(37)-N6)-threonylcarbamoyltransferase complex dimerization subunit type 1 TsaB [Hydrogenophaga sp.]MDD3785079.1 tRNA (adenosine(37)-N6)-threonylcarbamoyltransferase complex dimerization subunit type 1 TsaB [Hydrogenophaga sp.]
MNEPLRLLCIDASTDALSVAVGSGLPGAAVQAYQGPGAAQASTTLLPVIQGLLAQTGWRLAELDAIVFGRGPGAFTGLRTACAVAQGLAWGVRSERHPAGLPVLPLDTLAAVAEEGRERRRAAGLTVPDAVVAMLDARMDEIYVAIESGDGRAIAEPRLCAPEAMAAHVQACVPDGATVLLAGNVFDAYGDRLAGVPGERQVAVPTAAALLRLAPAAWHAGRAVPAHEALPLYVRDKVARTTAEREGR